MGISVDLNKLRHRGVHWINSYDHELRLLILSIIVGIIGGFAAIGFRRLIQFFSIIFTSIKSIGSGNFLLAIFAPTLGGLIVGTLIFYSANEARGHGIPEMIKSISLDNGIMRIRVPFVEMMASAITIGSGGSSGREGPIAYISGALGSFVGRFFELKDEEIKTLGLAGVAAGISATFNAPIGGVLFGLEIVRRDQKIFNFLPLITASVVGVTLSEFFIGKQPAFIFPSELSYGNSGNIPYFIILGVLVGLFSVLWIRFFYLIGDILHNLSISPILLATLGGFTIGIISIFVPEISGSDYGPINDAFALKFTIQFVVVLLIVKMIATSITIGSGMSGGVSAPTLYLGVMLGTVFGYILHFFNLSQAPIVLFAFLGMGALFGATMRAPLTAVILMSEMVDDYQLFVPLMFSIVFSWIVSKEIMSHDIYTHKLSRMGVEISEDVDVLEHISVEHIMTTEIDTVSPMDRLEAVLDLMKKTGHTGYPVVDENKLFGIITEHDVDKAIEQRDMRDWIIGEICTTHVTSVVRTCPVSVAFTKMVDQQINRFPVIESQEDHTLVGWITRSDLMRAYRTAKAESKFRKHEDKLFEEVIPGDLEFTD